MSEEGDAQPVFVYRAEFEKKTLNVDLTLDGDGRIAGLELGTEGCSGEEKRKRGFGAGCI